MARMIMSAGSSELYQSRKRPPPGSSQCGVLKRLKAVGDEDENDHEKGYGKKERDDKGEGEEQDEMKAGTRESEHVFPPYMPSTAAHTIRRFTLGHHENEEDEIRARAAQILIELSRANSEMVQPSPVQPDLNSRALSPDIHTPIPTSTSSTSSSSSDPTPLTTHRLILKARTHLHSARVKIARHPRSRYIETPEAGLTGVTNKRKRGDERVVEERVCPKRVMMEGMYPGVGMGVLEALREGGGFDGGGRGLARDIGVGRREEEGKGEEEEGWGGFELVAGRAIGI